MKSGDLIRYISWYATRREMRLTTVRLVKFVYLADLYYAREHKGKTLTGFPWAFVYYGPYCREVMSEIEAVEQKGLICKVTLESKFGDKDFHLFSCHDDEAERLEDSIPTEVLYPLRASVRKYGEDTQALLDHIYFETEPMEAARKGDLLDFSKAKPFARLQPVKLKKLSKQKIKKAKMHIDKLCEKMKRNRAKLHEENLQALDLMDEAYFDALEYMEGDDLEPGLKGVARIIEQ
jgi:hypothetical protein